MKAHIRILLIVLFILSSVGFGQKQNKKTSYKPGEVLVRFRESVDSEALSGLTVSATKEERKAAKRSARNAVLSAAGGGSVKHIYNRLTGLSVVELPEGISVEESVKAYKKMPGVLYAEPNYRYQLAATYPNDPRFNEQWGLENTGQTGGSSGADIHAPDVWDFETGIEPDPNYPVPPLPKNWPAEQFITVAVIDTGVDYNHPDLAGNMKINPGEWENPDDGSDNDDNGFIDDVYGYDFVGSYDMDPNPGDPNYGNEVRDPCAPDGDPMDFNIAGFSHGTHVAGIIGAVGNNGIGISGVCWDVRIMALKVFGDNPKQGGGDWSTDDATLVQAIGYAVDNGANIINISIDDGMLSLKEPGYSQSLYNAIEDAQNQGVLVVAAAGNNNSDNDALPFYPASYGLDNIISVMATDDDDNRASFSNYGAGSVDIGAPGVNILSCQLGGDYSTMSGTSMAAPHVAGAAALLWSHDPSLSLNSLKCRLLAWTDPELANLCVSGGRLNIYKAVDMPLPGTPRNLFVPTSPYPTIEAAFALAQNGDRIIVMPGTHYINGIEGVSFLGRNITLMSTNPTDPDIIESTIIDCGGRGRAFKFCCGEGAGSVIKGFTIRNGHAAGAWGIDGALPGRPIDLSDPNVLTANRGEETYGDGKGGAIYCGFGSSPTIENCVIEDCTASGAIGGRGNDGLDALEDSDDDGEWGGDGGGGNGNGYGGAIYCEGASNPTLVDCKITGCKAMGGIGSDGGDGGDGGGSGKESFGGNGGNSTGDGFGGAIYCDDNSSPELTDCQISDNYASHGETGKGGQKGEGSSLDPAATDGADGLIWPGSEGFGGAAYYANHSDIDFDNVEISGNAAYWQYQPELQQYGYNDVGAIHLEDGDANMLSCTIEENKPGAIYSIDGGDLVFNDCGFISNTESWRGGGAVYSASGGSVTATNCRFSANETALDTSDQTHGGALYCIDNNITLNGCSFGSNSASGDGGAVYSTALNIIPAIEVNDCSFINNESTMNGGAVAFMPGTGNYDYGFNAAITGSYFLDNKADSAAGLYLLYSTPGSTMSECVIAGNIASGDVAGGIRFLQSQMEISHCKIYDNRVEGLLGAGGGVSVWDMSPVFRNCLITGNFAESFGGGIVCDMFSTPTITNCTISSNTTNGDGGGIVCDMFALVTVKDSIFDNCNGHAIYEGDTGDVTVSYSLFYNNTYGAFYDNGVSKSDSSMNGVSNNIGGFDPVHQSGSFGDYYLHQLQSPAVDAGSMTAVAAGLNTRTTDPCENNDLDSGDVDMGYHYLDSTMAAKYVLTIEVIGGHGDIEIVSPEPIDPNNIYAGTPVELKAKPDPGWRVEKWSGTDDDASYLKTNAVVMNSDRNVTVEFEQARLLEVGGDGDYATVNSAIYDARDGDTIVINTGIWLAPVHLSKSVSITSKNPDDPDVVAATIFDGTGYVGPAIIFLPGSEEAILNGFTIRNCKWGIIDADDGDRNEGHPDGWDGGSINGGAIQLFANLSPTIKNCIIRDNWAGGGDAGDGVNATDDEHAGRGGWGGFAHGGAIYCGPGSSATFNNCQIINNTVTGGDGGDGGDVQGDGGHANYGGNWSWSNARSYDPFSLGWTVEDDLWEAWGYIGDYRWYSAYGGGVYCDVGSKVEFINCVIRGNRTRGGMSGIGGEQEGADQWPQPAYEIPSFGGGVYCAADANVIFTDCTIEDNIASEPNDPMNYHLDAYVGHGGGVCAEDTAAVIFNNCTVKNNRTPTGVGGGVYFGNANPDINDCNFIENRALHGGAVYGNLGAGEISGSKFTLNRATPYDSNEPDDPNIPYDPNMVTIIDNVFSRGGALYLWATDVNVVNCEIMYNRALASGGGVYIGGQDSPELHNCLIINNTAERDGAGVSANWMTTLSVSNCTIADNTLIDNPFTPDANFESQYGGGLYSSYESVVNVINSIFWGNTIDGSTAEPFGQQIAIGTGFEFDERPSRVAISYSDVEDGNAASAIWVDPNMDPSYGLDWDDATNLEEDPRFITGYLGDYFLMQLTAGQQLNSPCVDAGLGDPYDLGLEGFTTRTDAIEDSGIVDVGYHYDTRVSLVTYTLTIDLISDPNYGTIDPNDGDHEVKGIVQLIAEPNLSVPGDPESKWDYKVIWDGTDDDNSVNYKNTVTMDGDKTVTVEFEYIPRRNLIVPDQYTTIQEAVDDTYYGDTIYLQPCDINEAGLPIPYTGPNNVDIDLKGRNITISGINPTDPDIVARTVIDCDGSEDENHRAFIFQSGEDANCIIRGLTIANGYMAAAYGGHTNYDANGFIDVNDVNGIAAEGDAYGGGVLCINSNPTFEDCVITNCIVTGGYGGHGGDGWTDVEGNGTDGGGGGIGTGSGYGGGVYCSQGSNPSFTRCDFIANRASGGVGGTGGDGGVAGDGEESSGGSGGVGIGYGYGGAICFASEASPEIDDCNFVDNVATGGVGGLAGPIGFGSPTDPRAADGVYGTFEGVGYGGAIYIGKESEPKVTDTTFTNNGAYDIWYGNLPENPFASVLFLYLTMEGSTQADINDIFEQFYHYGGIELEGKSNIGGGIYSEDECQIDVNNCDFINNFGGGLYCVADCNVILNYSDFAHNTTDIDGGGVFIGPNSLDTSQINNCVFSANASRNEAPFGGGGGLNSQSNVTLELCTFSGNKAESKGGGMFFYDTNSTPATLTLNMNNCSFVQNSAVLGGGVYWNKFNAYLTDTYVIGNTAEKGGGLFLVDGGDIDGNLVTIDGGVIKGNTATSDVGGGGGGLYGVNILYGTFANLRVMDNEASGANGSGGGFKFVSSTYGDSVENCLFANNFAKSNGGALALYLGSGMYIPDVNNCTFTDNWAGECGGGIFCDWTSSLLVQNSIFNNCDRYAIYEDGVNGDAIVEYCLFYKNPYSSHGIFFDEGTTSIADANALNDLTEASNNVDCNPHFVKGNLGDYYLTQGDPNTYKAIDGGSDDANSMWVVDANMADYTTSTIFGQTDSGTVDIGYHYIDVDPNDPSYKFTLATEVLGSIGGSISPESGNYYRGEVVDLEATPDSGWRIKEWTGADNDSITTKTNTVVMSSDKVVTVEFDQVTTFNVGPDGDYGDIRDALHDAVDGDIVIVDTGIWRGPQLQIDKSVTITSKYPDDPACVAATIIDYNDHAGPLLYFGADTDSGTVFNGFTIRSANWYTSTGVDGDNPGENGADGICGAGGAIYIEVGAAPIIKNCIIRDNSILGGFGGNGSGADTDHNAGRGGWGGWAWGGGVYCGEGSSPTFINCQIVDNIVVGGTGGNGGNWSATGGRANYGGNWSRAEWWNIDPRNLNQEWIEGNLYERWTEMAPYTPLWSGYSKVPFNSLNWILGEEIFYGYYGDYRWYSGYGGGVFCDIASTVTFIDCVISGNKARGGMSGLGGEEPGSGPIRVEPIVAYEIPSYGGGVYCAADTVVKFTGCTITNNETSEPNDPLNYHLDPYLGHGGGICAENSAQIVIEDCYISDNKAVTGVGGGIYMDDANPQMSDSVIRNNTALHGGGMTWFSGEGIIIGSEFTDNIVEPLVPKGPNDQNEYDPVFGQGGGLYLWATNANLTDCTISDNLTNGSGGGIYIGGEGAPDLTNCLITSNKAARDGGGISADWYAQPDLSSCTITNNMLTGEGFTDRYGGGLYCGYEANIDIRYSILWGNIAPYGHEVAIGNGFEYDPRPSTVNVMYSNIEGGASDMYIESGCILNGYDPAYPNSITNLIGESDDDPLFVAGRSGDYYLSQPDADPNQTELSPCVDPNISEAKAYDPTDDVNSLGLYRHTTRTDHVLDGDSEVDLGYHYLLASGILGDFDFDGEVNNPDYILLMQHWLKFGCEFPDWCDGTDLNKDGVVNSLDYALFAANWANSSEPNDQESPQPDRMTWAVRPNSASSISITMTATTATDNSGCIVEYWFECILGTDVGGNSRGWDPNETFVDEGLTDGAKYGYKVRARDESGNETQWSFVGYAVVGEIEPPEDHDAPLPDPMQWGADPCVVPSANSITLLCATATDQSGVEYWFQDTNDTQYNSGWQDSTFWTDVNLAPTTTYYYKVKARDKSLWQNETAWSEILSVTTLAEGEIPDTNAPIPNPPIWADGGYPREYEAMDFNDGLSWFYHTMEVAPCTDSEGSTPVEYYFHCYSVSSGVFDSGWQEETIYTTKVAMGPRSYAWQVKARDTEGNVTDYSFPAVVSQLP